MHMIISLIYSPVKADLRHVQHTQNMWNDVQKTE